MKRTIWIILLLIFHSYLFSDENTIVFNKQYNILKDKYLSDMESRKDDGSTWLIYKGNEKYMATFNHLITIALSNSNPWGVNKNGIKQPFSQLTEPYIISRDGKNERSNPFFFLSLKHLFESDRMKESALRDETIRNLITMYDDDKYKKLHVGINGGMPYSFIIADVLRRKWPADIQADMKKRLIRHITQENLRTDQPRFLPRICQIRRRMGAGRPGDAAGNH